MLKLAFAAVAVILGGCATQQQADPALLATANRQIICVGKADCDMKWSRALQWILNNSTYRIQSQSDMLITTAGPLQYDPRPAFVVSRIKLTEQSEAFDFRAGCDNVFGCQPSLVQERASFANAVMGHTDASRRDDLRQPTPPQ